MQKIQEEGGRLSLFFLIMIDKETVKKIVEDYLKSSDNYLVSIEVKPDNTVIVAIDNDEAVSIDDCITLSACIESQLDREKEDFALEVGSAGIGQALKIRRQYRKYIGKTVEILAKSGIKYAGILKVSDEEKIVLTIQKQVKPEGAKRKVTVEEDLFLLYDDIKYAKYNF